MATLKRHDPTDVSSVILPRSLLVRDPDREAWREALSERDQWFLDRGIHPSDWRARQEITKASKLNHGLRRDDTGPNDPRTQLLSKG